VVSGFGGLINGSGERPGLQQLERVEREKDERQRASRKPAEEE